LAVLLKVLAKLYYHGGLAYIEKDLLKEIKNGK
jgi:hypothetical protein